MRRSPKVVLEDIRLAAASIENATRSRSFGDYHEDQLRKSAVERWFMIIGEALTRLEKIDPAWCGKITDFRKIVGFRNVLVHGYEAIDDQVVWKTIQEYLPVLQSEVQAHLG